MIHPTAVMWMAAYIVHLGRLDNIKTSRSFTTKDLHSCEGAFKTVPIPLRQWTPWRLAAHVLLFFGLGELKTRTHNFDMYSTKRSMASPGLTGRRAIPALTMALAAAGLLPSVHAQLQTAGDLLVSVDATTAPIGPLNSIPNTGTLGGVFQATGAAGDKPVVGPTYGNGTRAMQFDGTDFLQHVASVGGAKVNAPAGLVGANPTSSIEAWVMNPWPDREETIVSWGKRGGPDGSNKSFNYGWDARWGAIGHWGSPDIGWDSGFDSDFYPPGVPTPGLWHHLVITFDGTTTRVYSDGVLKNQENVTLNTHAGTPITIGAQLEADGVTVTGALRATMAIGRLRIHDGALTDAQVANNYNFEKAQFVNGTGTPAPGPIHRYSFNESAGAASSGTAVIDSAGGANGTILGDGANLTGSRVTIPGGPSSSAAYVDLPNGMISKTSQDKGGSGKLTLEGWVKVTGVQAWSRVFDFGSSDVADPGLIGGEVPGPGGGGEGLDYLFLSAQSEGTARPDLQAFGLRNIDPPGGGGIDTRIGYIGLNQEMHFAVTWDESTGEFKVYENGGEALVTRLPSPDRMSSVNDVNVWLGRSNWTGDSNLQGEYDEFRVYDRVLTADEVKGSYLAGANSAPAPAPLSFAKQPTSQTVQQAGSVTFSVAAQGVRPYTFQWYRGGAIINGATSPSLTLDNVAPGDNGATFYCVVRNGSQTATSDTATLTVVVPEPPRVVSVTPQIDFTTITVVFENKVLETSAENTGNYSLAPAGVTVTGAVLDAAGKTVTLTTSPMAEGATYTLTVKDIRDAANVKNIDPNPTLRTFTTALFSPGLVKRQWFNGITGDNNVQRVLEHPKYINNTPDYSCLTNLFEANNADTCDNCGEQVVGVFVPKVSGDHVFYLAADDGATLFFGTDATPASKVRIANEPVWSSRRLWTGEAEGGGRGTPPANVSAPISLIAGKRYYIEAVVKEGGGGDHVAVAVQEPGAPVPGNGSTPITAGYLGVFTQPDPAATVSITQHPANVTTVENQTATFTAAATGSSPACGSRVTYQWQKNGVNIPGAVGATLTIDRVSLADDGAQIVCNAYVPGLKASSSAATLRVNADNEGPKLVSAIGSAEFTTMVVQFDEYVVDTEAEDPFSYGLDGGIQVTAAVLNPDGRSVTLTTDPQAPNTVYTLTVNGLKDLKNNEMIANSTIQVQSWVLSCGGVEFSLYKQVGGGTDINILVNHPTFPNSPDEVRRLQTFNTGADIQDNYGGRVRGLFIPPVSGAWRLYVTADDGSRVFFNPNGPNAAGKVLISEETPGCCTAFAGRPAGPFNLVAGQGYYLEGIYKEAGGGDYIRIAARPESDTTTALTPMPPAWAGYPAAPPGVGGPVNITTQPPPLLQVPEQTVASISVVANNPNGLPLCYQWQASADGGASYFDIDGATSPTLSRTVDFTLDGLKVRCAVSVIGTTVLSAVTTLDVLVDDQPPRVASTKGSETFDQITIKYNELVEEQSAADAFGYTISGGLEVKEGKLLSDGMTVVLTLTSPMAEGQVYEVTINDVKDRAANPNTIAPNTRVTVQSFVISCGFLNFASYKNIGGTAVSALTSAPNYPDNPDERGYLSAFDTRTIYPTDALENYGGRITGYFVPPTSGDWILYLRSDDASEMWFNKKDGAGKQLVQAETGCCRAFSALPTPALTLVAGEKYPIEVLYKEGGGGDYAQVAARLASDTTSALVPIPGSMVAAAADPTGVDITITQQPVNVLHIIDVSNPSGAGTTLVTEDFGTGNGGYTVQNSGNPASPWSYNAAAGGWSCYHTDPCGPPQNASRLISPPITLTKSGRVGIVLTHRYSFEGDSWDGGQLRVSVNGGPFTTVPAGAFSEGGYTSTSLIGNHQLLGQAAWNGDSANVASGQNITSRGSLGSMVAGDVIQIQLIAAWDECTTGRNPSWFVDALTITEGAQDPTFRVRATGAIAGNPNYAPFIQWERNNGSGWVAVPNGTSQDLLLNPVLADNGARFRAQLYVPGMNKTSGEATLTVVQLNTPPKFDCGPAQTVAEDSGPQTVPDWAQNISVHSITRVPITFASAFDSLPSGSRLLDPSGAATRPNPRVEGGYLKLTDANDAGGFGGWAIGPFATATYESVNATWKSRIGGGGGGGADGYSLNIGTDLSDNFTGEEGTGSGLSVTVDTFDNGGGEVGIDIRWRGAQVVFQAIPKDNAGDGNYLRKDTFVDASLSVSPSGLATFNYDGNIITAQLTGYDGIRANQINFGARTGGANDNQWIDDLSIQGFPFDASSAEAGQTVQFLVSNDNPSLFSAQPAISPNGTLTYTPAPNACGVANVTAVAKDSGGTAYGGKDTSAECRFTITVNGVNDAPVALGSSVTTTCEPLRIPLTASDVDAGTCGSGILGLSIVVQPAHGILAPGASLLEVVYTPNNNYSGPDSFQYVVSDGTLSSAPATVSITVPSCNTPPTAKLQVSPLADFSPSVANKLAISCNGSNVCLTADGSQSSDLESPNSDLRFDWLVNGVLVASGESATVCLDVGEAQTITLVVTDPQGATGTDSIVVDVVSAGDAIEELIGKVNDSSVTRKNKRPFIASLKAAAASADRGNAVSAQGQLHAFQNKTRAQIARDNPDDAQCWIRWAQMIIDALQPCVEPPGQ